MPQQLHGYEDNLSSKGSSLREVTVTKQGDKAALDVALTSDVELGSVEIKNATTDDRAVVLPNGQLSVTPYRVDGTELMIETGTTVSTTDSFSLLVGLRDIAGNQRYLSGVDTIGDAHGGMGGGNALTTRPQNYVFNGSTWDRQRGDTDGTHQKIIGVSKIAGVDGVDAVTNTLQIIEYEHHEVHSGSYYRVHINKDVANGGTFNVCFTTPNTTKWPHMIFNVDVEVEARIEIIEAPTSFSGGTAITPLNANRNSGNTSGIINMVQDATITRGSPVVLDVRVVGSAKSTGGKVRAEAEWVLKQNTIYCLIITNQAPGATNETNIDLEWYEHTNKN